MAATAETSRRWWHALLLGGAGPVLALALLYAFRVPLGRPGRFVYLYSPVVSWRLAALPSALALAALAALGIWLLGSGRRGRRAGGRLLLAGSVAGLAVWAYRAPPDHLKQHIFNTQSPSQDGAFLREAARIERPGAYLRAFPERARTPPAEMRGTRVISNPPATTLLAYAVRRVVVTSPALQRALAPHEADVGPEYADFRIDAAAGLALCGVFTALWALSGPVLYAVGRLYFAPAAAATFALGCLVTPATLLLTPGKDPAQLLTSSLLLLLWLRAVQDELEPRAAGKPAGRPFRPGISAGAAGAVLVLACQVSLVHVWVAGVIGAATAGTAVWEGTLRRLLLRRILPALLGGLAAAAVLYGVGLDVVATVLAVAKSQAAVTRGPGAMPWAWQMAGIPLFALFAGAALWCGAFWLSRDRERCRGEPGARLGAGLLAATAVVLLLTAGYTNIETPRLWIPFVPLLLLGMALRLALFRRPARAAAAILALLAFVQVAAAALQWVLMDMREAEMRLLEGRFFG